MAENSLDYLNLLTSQYQGTVRFKKWLQTSINMLTEAKKTTLLIDPAFNLYNEWNGTSDEITIDDASIVEALLSEAGFPLMIEGNSVLLDILGTILGQSRELNFQPSHGESPILNDENYRILLKAKVLINQWNGKYFDLQEGWKQIFPGGKIVVHDNQNMSLDVMLIGSFSNIIMDMIRNGLIIPKPQGVRINYLFGDLPYFGFDRDDEYISGFDRGHLF